MYVTCCNISRECLINLSAVAAAAAAAADVASCSNDLASSHFPITIYVGTHTTHTHTRDDCSDSFHFLIIFVVFSFRLFCSFDIALACILAQCTLAKAISCPSMCAFNLHIALCRTHTYTHKCTSTQHPLIYYVQRI